MDDSIFAVFWKHGPKRTDMTIKDIYGLPFDLASWAAFLGVLMGTRRYAPMTMHSEHDSEVKVMIASDADNTMSFDTIT